MTHNATPRPRPRVITRTTWGCNLITVYDAQGEPLRDLDSANLDEMSAYVVRVGVFRKVPIAYVTSPWWLHGTPPPGLDPRLIDPYGVQRKKSQGGLIL